MTDISWLDEKGISTKDGIGYTGSEERYIAALQRFFKGYEKNRKAGFAGTAARIFDCLERRACLPCRLRRDDGLVHRSPYR